MKILDGKKVAAELFEKLKPRVQALKKRGIEPQLVFFLIGKNPASQAYVRMKQKASEEVDIYSNVLEYEESVTQEELLKKIEELNQDQNVHGMMIQLPLPEHLSVPQITRAMDPKKDADGFQAYNLGKMFLSKDFEDLPPATALGIIRLIDAYKIDVTGMDVTVLGRSNLIGKPVSVMLINRSATVTVCHSKSKNVEDHCRRADMIIAATGTPHLVKKDWVKKGAVVIDAGYAQLDGQACGDVDFEAVAPLCSWITPVPGGVGPMTIYAIVENTVRAAERQTS